MLRHLSPAASHCAAALAGGAATAAALLHSCGDDGWAPGRGGLVGSVAAPVASAAASGGTTMDRIRANAGLRPGADPWGAPMSTETLRRLNSIDIPALAAARLAAVEAQNPPGTHHDTLLMQAMLQQNEELCLHLQAVGSLADRWEVRFVEYNVWFKDFQKWFKENWMYHPRNIKIWWSKLWTD